ncbi:hypothetical protein WICMUC_000396 [Wickerhamomyces mucosus]|uniref:Uncharacterized protein n=1 Tax=Wickerhamomyces mucosus TaxID=1378264 RepID=A0A9P8TIR8_9ASCO|nr:hypothetical protein WICMUC_000396 [Wickerhamomyces mucosus]
MTGFSSSTPEEESYVKQEERSPSYEISFSYSPNKENKPSIHNLLNNSQSVSPSPEIHLQSLSNVKPQYDNEQTFHEESEQPSSVTELHQANRSSTISSAEAPNTFGLRTREMINYRPGQIVPSFPALSKEDSFMGLESTYTYVGDSDTDFKDPYEVIESFKGFGSIHGAIKVRPPKDWKKTFVLKLKDLQFPVLVQSSHTLDSENDKSNTIENNRVKGAKYSFYKDLVEFYKEKKMALSRLPSIDKRMIDLYQLKKLVDERGGFDIVCAQKLWAQIGRELGYNAKTTTSLSSSLKLSYMKTIIELQAWREERDKNESFEPPSEPNENNKRFISSGTFETKRPRVLHEVKIPVISNSKTVFKRSKNLLKAKGFKTNFESFTDQIDGITQVDDFTFPYYDFHYWNRGIEVLDSPYPSSQVSQIQSFKKFIASHPDEVKSLEAIERFLTEDIFGSHSQTSNNLPTDIYGSGFITLENSIVGITDIEEAKDPWNLHNIPISDSGLLKFLSDDQELSKTSLDINQKFSITSWKAEDHLLYSIDYQHLGSSKLWLFISPEDQEKYEALLADYSKDVKSTKTMTSTSDEDFLQYLSQELIDELSSNSLDSKDQFDFRSDTINPKFMQFIDKSGDNKLRYNTNIILPLEILKQNGIKINYSIQQPGEFIIKFPKCYSMSISMGPSVSEHVNFAAHDWLNHGIDANNWTLKQGLLPAFSFYQLLTNIIESENHEAGLLKLIAPILNGLIEEELDLRNDLKYKIPSLKVISNKYDYISDNNLRNVFPTKAIINDGNDHFILDPRVLNKLIDDNLFDGDEFKIELHYYHSDERLKALQKLSSSYSQSRKSWLKKYDELLSSHEKPTLKALKSLYTESEKIFEEIPEAAVLRSFIDFSNNWISKAQEILNVKLKNRVRNRRGPNKQPSQEESEVKEIFEVQVLADLMSQISCLTITAPEVDQLIELSNEVYQYEVSVRNFLNDYSIHHTLEEFFEWIDLGKSLGVKLESVEFLERIVRRMDWIERYNELEKDRPETRPKSLNEYIALHDEGYDILGFNDTNTLETLLGKIKTGKFLSAKINHVLQSSYFSVTQLKAFLDSSKSIPIEYHVSQKLIEIQDKHSKAVDERNELWDNVAKNSSKLAETKQLFQKKLNKDPSFSLLEFENLTTGFRGDENDVRPFYSKVKETINKSREMNPSEPPYTELDYEIRQSEEWVRRLKRMFGKVNAPFNVMKQHLTTLLDQASFAMQVDDIYIKSDENNDKEHKTHYCLCRRSESGTMIACERCNEWYHCKCLKVGRGKMKGVDKYICPICDYRITVPKEYNTPSLEDMENMTFEGSTLVIAPDDFEIVRKIYEATLQYKKFLETTVLSADGNLIQDLTLNELKFYVRKLEGSSVLINDHYNRLRYLIWERDPFCDTAPPIVDSGTKTKAKKKTIPSTQEDIVHAPETATQTSSIFEKADDSLISPSPSTSEYNILTSNTSTSEPQNRSIIPESTKPPQDTTVTSSTSERILPLQQIAASAQNYEDLTQG